MARSFTSTDKAVNSTGTPGVVTAAAFTIGGWIYPVGTATAAAAGYLVPRMIGENGGYWGIGRGNILAAGDQVTVHVYDGGDKKVSANATTGQWDHWIGRLSGGTLELFKNGVSQGTLSSGNIQVITGSLVSGQNYLANNTGNIESNLAHIFCYTAALSDAEVNALGKGVCPLIISRANLKLYLPYPGDASPELELIQRLDMTLSGTAQAAEPPILLPQGIWVNTFAAAATPVSGSDTGSGADAATLAASSSGAETSTGTESGSLAAAASGAETGTDTESASATATAAGSEIGAGTESGSAAVAGSGSETGGGTEGGSGSAALSGAEAGTGAEGQVSVLIIQQVNETGHGVENASVVASAAGVRPEPSVLFTGAGSGKTGGRVVDP